MTFLSQVNGIDTVRVPVSLEPYKDVSAKYQKQLRKQPHAGAGDPEADTVETDSEESENQSGGLSGPAAGASAARSEETRTPSNENPKKD